MYVWFANARLHPHSPRLLRAMSAPIDTQADPFSLAFCCCPTPATERGFSPLIYLPILQGHFFAGTLSPTKQPFLLRVCHVTMPLPYALHTADTDSGASACCQQEGGSKASRKRVERQPLTDFFFPCTPPPCGSGFFPSLLLVSYL